MKLRLGISTCPNDTFAFHAILERLIPLPDLEFEVELLDVEELNRGLFEERFDVAKASFHAALHLSKTHALLPSGSAIGFGVGPLLLASRSAPPQPTASSLVLCPGRWTTASLLLSILHPRAERIENVVFSRIMPALATGEADFGVVIHEGRFTYQEHGLRLVSDLGADWETLSGGPVTLGGILVKRTMDPRVQVALGDAIARSIAHARNHPEEAQVTMQRHAQELREDVLWSHVDLYVNEDTVRLGSRARQSLRVLDERARAAGLLAPDVPSLRIVPTSDEAFGTHRA